MVTDPLSACQKSFAGSAEEQRCQLAHAQERLTLQLNDTVINGIFAATLDMGSAIRLTTQPDVRALVTSAIRELDSVIQLIMRTALDQGVQGERR